jgi:hypothetical protein
MAKPKAERKPRSDSVAEVTRISQGATQQIVPPAHVPLTEAQWPFWLSVIDEYARADWTFHQLELAAMLARTMCSLEEQQRLLEEEGVIKLREVFDKEGDLKRVVEWENARARGVQTMMGQVLSIRRSLALHVRGKSGGNNKDAAHQREANREVERKTKQGKDDELLA